MEEYENEEEALQAACNIFGLSLGEVKAAKSKRVLYEFPEGKILDVYKVDENLEFGIGWTRISLGKVMYGLWVIENEKTERF